MSLLPLRRRTALAAWLTIGFPGHVFAHVKWFSTYSFAERPLSLGEILSPLFGALFVLSTLCVGAIVVFDERLTRAPWYAGLSARLNRYATRSDLVLRVAVGGVLLLSWQSGALLVPEIPTLHPVLELAQLGLAVLILANRFVAFAGYALLGLYAIAYGKYGALHMLDYVYLVGAGYYLIASNANHRKVRASGLPLLYASVGFSLAWVALEKLVYPQWGLQILDERPNLTLGFDPAFFLTTAAFVEFTLGFLLIFCLIQRPIAIAVTGLFMTTTLVFGKLEFIGHAIVHAAMIVFILEGRGDTFRTPITFFYHMRQRVGFAVLAFVGLYLVMLMSYDRVATNRYLASRHGDHEMPTDLVAWEPEAAPPHLAMDVQPDAAGGWNVHVIAEPFRFVPEQAGAAFVPGEGHAHLYIDDRKVARLYGPWHHVPTLEPGPHEFMVTLNASDHRRYASEGQPLVARCSVHVE